MSNTARQLFDNFIFPAFLDGLKREKTKSLYVAVKESIENECGKPFLLLDENDGLFFSSYMRENYSPSTAYVRLAYIRSIGTFTEQNASELMEGTVYAHYRSPFRHIRIDFVHSDFVDENRIPTPGEINDFIENCSPAVKLMCAMVIKCGFTTNQVRTFCFSDIRENEIGEKYIMIHDKGEVRYVYLPEDLFGMIRTYVSTHTPSPEGYVFTNAYGKSCSERVFEMMYKNECNRLDFNYKLPDLRNAAATYMLTGGAEGEDVVDILGISRKWMARFDKCHDRASQFNASSYSVIELKPHAYARD